MTYKWQEKHHSPRHLRFVWSGQHVLTTEAQTLDEALDICERQRRIDKRLATLRERPRKQPSLKLLLAAHKASAAALAAKKRRAAEKKPDPFAYSTLDERDAMIRHLHGSGYWSAGDVGRKFRLSVAEVLAIVERGKAMIKLVDVRAGQVLETCGLTVNHEQVPDGRRFTVESESDAGGDSVLLIRVRVNRQVVPLFLHCLSDAAGVIYGFREVDHD